MAGTIDKKGRILTRADFEAQAKRAGQDLIFVIDMESREILQQILVTMRKVETHLSYITDEQVKEEDANGNY